jgi:exodeoxyribonuclease-3
VTSLRLVSWNINSVRIRVHLIEQLVKEHDPDIICLQETKCTNDQFPEKFFKKLGYEHIALNGQKGYHGVATVSRVPFKSTSAKSFCGKDDTRHIMTKLADDVEIHNFYVPAGGDIPDTEKNEKFAHKLSFLTEMRDWFKNKKNKKTNKLVLLGDLNIAPLEHDVWGHKQLLKVVSHTPIEVEHLDAVQKSHSWIDVTRVETPEPDKIYTWWSYRSADWTKNNRGRRLDHIWVTPALKDRAHSIKILPEARSWERPSDHVPVLMSIDL